MNSTHSNVSKCLMTHTHWFFLNVFNPSPPGMPRFPRNFPNWLRVRPELLRPDRQPGPGEPSESGRQRWHVAHAGGERNLSGGAEGWQEGPELPAIHRVSIWGSPKIRWFTREHPMINKWMMTGGTPISGSLHIIYRGTGTIWDTSDQVLMFLLVFSMFFPCCRFCETTI